MKNNYGRVFCHFVRSALVQLCVKMATERALETRDVTKIASDSTKPERIFLFSGKRKSGKDYITDILYNR